MSKEIRLTHKKANELLDFIYSLGEVEVYEASSESEKEIIKFENLNAIKLYLYNAIKKKEFGVRFAFYFKETKGKINIKKIDFISEGNGHGFRYDIEGWAIFYVDFNFFIKEWDGSKWIKIDTDDISISKPNVNSFKRAQKWYSTCPSLGEPALWDWKQVESIMRKINKRIKLIAK